MSIDQHPEIIIHNKLSLLLVYTERLYFEYLSSNKQFLYAKILYHTNQRLYEALVQNSSIFKKEIRVDVIELMFHRKGAYY